MFYLLKITDNKCENVFSLLSRLYDVSMDGAGSIRQVRSAGRMTQRTYSNTTVGSMDDNVSLSSSSYSSGFKRYGSKTSNNDYSGVRASAGISRMKYGRPRRGSVYPNDVTGLTETSSAKGRRLSIYTLSDLAEVGIKMRRRRRSTMDSWGKNRTPGQTKYFDKVIRSVCVVWWLQNRACCNRL